MAFLSAEHAVVRGETHPFMALLQTDRQDLHLLFYMNPRGLAGNRTNQSAAFQCAVLDYVRFPGGPWPRGQHLADAEYAERIMTPGHTIGQWIGASLPTKIIQLLVLVPGLLRELVGNQKLWDLFGAYGLDRHKCDRAAEVARWWNSFFVSGKEERKLARTLRENPVASTWVCGKDRRPSLPELCRQRRRRVVQVRELQLVVLSAGGFG